MRIGSEMGERPRFGIRCHWRSGLIVERSGRVDTGGRRTSSEEALVYVGVTVELGEDRGGACAQRKAFALVMAGEAIGGCGGCTKDCLER